MAGIIATMINACLGIPLSQVYRVAALLLLLFAASCEKKPAAAKPGSTQRVWSSSGTTYGETDSLAACKIGDSVRLFATAKHAHRVDVFDAATGNFLRSVGAEGVEPAQFRRPNGIVIAYLAGDQDKPIILVVERDNKRVQAIWPDSYKSAGIWGGDILIRPYGATVAQERNGINLYVTDDRVPDHKCVRVFSILEHAGEIRGAYMTSFGDKDGPGAIIKPESIVWDSRARVLLICDEDPDQKNVKVYTPEGRFTGTIFAGGIVEGDPEGLVIADSSAGGFIILTDQRKDITIWHLFDRQGYQYLASLTANPRISNTDGICLFSQRFGRFKKGALFAVNNDAEICAFELDDFVLSAEKAQEKD